MRFLTSRIGRYAATQCVWLFLALNLGHSENVSATAAEPISLRELTEIAEPAQISVSPDERFVAFMVATPSVDRDETRTELVVVDLRDGRAILKSPNGPLIRSWINWLELESPQWAPDSRFVYVRALDGPEIQVWRVDVATGERRKITADLANVERIAVTQKGTNLNFWVRNNREDIAKQEEQAQRSGYLADDGLMLYPALAGGFWLEGRRATMMLRPGAVLGQPGGVVEIGHGPLRRKAIDLGTGDVRELGVEEERSTPVWRTKDVKAFDDSRPGEVAVVRESPNVPGRFDFATLQIVQADDGKIVSQCTLPDCQGVIQGVRWDAHKVVFIKNDASGSRRIVAAWDPDSGRVHTIVSLSGILEGAQPYRVSGKEADCPIVRHLMICVYEDAAVAPRVVKINLSNGHVETLYDANPHITADRLPRVETESWNDDLGDHLFSKLVLPVGYQAGRRYPLVIATYMCKGFLRGGSGDEFPEFLFAQVGIMSICVHYNGAQAPQYANSMSEVMAVPPALERVDSLYEKIIVDLDRRGLIDVKNIGIGGLSWSSKVVEWELFHSKRFAAASIAAPSLPDPIWADWMSLRRWDEVRPLYNLPPSDNPADAAWQEISPALNARKIVTPLLVNAVENEARMGIQLYAALRRERVPLELYVYPQEEHQIFAFPSHRANIYRRNVDWFRFWLQGFEDPDPTKTEQYARWRDMRVHRKLVVD